MKLYKYTITHRSSCKLFPWVMQQSLIKMIKGFQVTPIKARQLGNWRPSMPLFSNRQTNKVLRNHIEISYFDKRLNHENAPTDWRHTTEQTAGLMSIYHDVMARCRYIDKTQRSMEWFRTASIFRDAQCSDVTWYFMISERQLETAGNVKIPSRQHVEILPGFKKKNCIVAGGIMF